MPQQVLSTVENNFTKGLITEATGLNFPENAATSANNCEFTLIGDVVRRLGIDQEINGAYNPLNFRTNLAITTYKWNNAGGNGQNQLLVTQIGPWLYVYNVSTATVNSPLSAQGGVNINNTVIYLPTYLAAGASFDATVECQFADGNGYLFVFNQALDPLSIFYAPPNLNVVPIVVQIRDFIGSIDGFPVSTRPSQASANNQHQYNLQNQGWTSAPAWQAVTTPINTGGLGNNTTYSFTIQAGLPINNGDTFVANSQAVFGIPAAYASFKGTVVGYVGATITVTINSVSVAGGFTAPFVLNSVNTSYIGTWISALGNYPSNADVWWYFKDSTNTFNPAVTQPKVTLSTGKAPQGHYIMNAWNLDRSQISGLQGLNPVTTTTRPSTGAWFQGRVWYTGVNAAFSGSFDEYPYSWSENIYFSQINVGSNINFGNCFQLNDPTSEQLFDLLPTDGGIIQIQGSGRIYKLFPIQNGLLVFAANGVWFITGSQGIGFSASDYTVTKISSVTSFSSTSFVDVLGLPYFWNQEGIYEVQASQNGQLQVNPLTVGTILTFYNNIPQSSKIYARGAYDPINYTIQWIYKTTQEVSVTDRYNYDGILNYNTYNKAFFPFTVDISNAAITGITYVQGPGGVNTPTPELKYFYCVNLNGVFNFSFADEHDQTYTDWTSAGTPKQFTSTFTTGFKLHGQGWRKFQAPYIYVFSRNSGAYMAYYIQGAWDYTSNFNSGKWTHPEFAEINDSNTGMFVKRHRVRGRGRVLQLMFTSIPNQPFDFMGWAEYDNANAGG